MARDRLAIVDDGYLERGIKIPEGSLPSWITKSGIQTVVDSAVETAVEAIADSGTTTNIDGGAP